MVDLKFTDLLGTWQHRSFPIETWSEGTFKDCVGFDGSSIRGWQAINVSDMLAIPDSATTVIYPFFAESTVRVIANIVDPETCEDYTRDPRHVVRKATDTSRRPRLPTPVTSVPNPSSSSSTRFATDRTSIGLTMRSTPLRDP